MSRLTEKYNDNYVTKGYFENTDIMKDTYNAIQKLGKLEDLEEKIGFSLEVAFKALKDGIYTKESVLDKELALFDVRGIDEKGISVISKFCSYAECDFSCYYTDYKKTWWLKEDRSE